MKTKPKKLALWTQLPSASRKREQEAKDRAAVKSLFVARKRAAQVRKRKTTPKPWANLDDYRAEVRLLGQPVKPRKRIRPVSKRKAEERKLYAKERDAWLAKWKDCWRCLEPKKLELHHSRGRLGPLLRNQLYWVALCPECHTWIHNNIEAARARNLIAAAGDWNKV